MGEEDASYRAWRGEVVNDQGGLTVAWARVRVWTLCPDKPAEGECQGYTSSSHGPCVEGDQEAASGLFGDARLPTVD